MWTTSNNILRNSRKLPVVSSEFSVHRHGNPMNYSCCLWVDWFSNKVAFYGNRIINHFEWLLFIFGPIEMFLYGENSKILENRIACPGILRSNALEVWKFTVMRHNLIYFMAVLGNFGVFTDLQKHLKLNKVKTNLFLKTNIFKFLWTILSPKWEI